jgi:hypothetical protein
MPWNPHWRRKRPSAKACDAVLWALRGGIELSPHELACETELAWRRVCAALNDLLRRGELDVENGKYRRTDRVERRSA